MKASQVWVIQAVILAAVVGSVGAVVSWVVAKPSALTSTLEAMPSVTPSQTSTSITNIAAPIAVPSATPNQSSNLAAHQSVNYNQSPQTKLPTQTDTYPRHPLILVDEATPGSDFFQFRDRLRRAIRERDAAFIRQIADPHIKLSFGLPQTLSDLEIDSPDAVVWQQLERALGTGCVVYPIPGSTTTQWVCPHAFLAPDQDGSIDAFSSVIIVGENINVRAEPTTDSPIVGTVSNEVLKFDQAAMADKPQEFWQAGETNAGWKAVILPNGNHGYVSSRYAYSPVGYRAFFSQDSSQANGPWRMTIFLAGD